jgi:hypothetical protein
MARLLALLEEAKKNEVVQNRTTIKQAITTLTEKTNEAVVPKLMRLQFAASLNEVGMAVFTITNTGAAMKKAQTFTLQCVDCDTASQNIEVMLSSGEAKTIEAPADYYGKVVLTNKAGCEVAAITSSYVPNYIWTFGKWENGEIILTITNAGGLAREATSFAVSLNGKTLSSGTIKLAAKEAHQAKLTIADVVGGESLEAWVAGSIPAKVTVPEMPFTLEVAPEWSAEGLSLIITCKKPRTVTLLVDAKSATLQQAVGIGKEPYRLLVGHDVKEGEELILWVDKETMDILVPKQPAHLRATIEVQLPTALPHPDSGNGNGAGGHPAAPIAN